MDVNIEHNGAIQAITSGAEAVRGGAGVLNPYIQRQAKLKFCLSFLAALFVIVAPRLVVFAPDGREAVSSIIAVALFIVTVGCAGFGTFAIKTPLVSATAGTVSQRRMTNLFLSAKRLTQHLASVSAD
jgi:hypothetical protein